MNYSFGSLSQGLIRSREEIVIPMLFWALVDLEMKSGPGVWGLESQVDRAKVAAYKVKLNAGALRASRSRARRIIRATTAQYPMEA